MDESFAQAREAAHDSAVKRCHRACALLLGCCLRWSRPRPRGDAAPTSLKAGVFEPGAAGARVRAAAAPTASRLTLARYRGKVVLLAFGFTNCAEVCPITLGDARAARARSSAPQAADVQVVYVTVDPERDDAAQHEEISSAASIPPSSAAPARARRSTRCAEELRHQLGQEDECRRQLHASAIPRPST